jgi:hypothetical protein
MAKPLVHLDPYEIPAHLIPPGIIYQWVAKKSGSRIDPQYQAMVEAGWGEVPYQRLEDHYRGRYRGEGTEIQIGGEVLMERAKEMSVVARDKEIDKALVNAGTGRTASVNLVQHVRLSASELNTAASIKLSSPEYVARRMKMIAEGADDSLIRGWKGSFMFIRPPTKRVVRHRWLGWLFNLISKETTEHFDD